jgi:hypothetical protein
MRKLQLAPLMSPDELERHANHARAKPNPKKLPDGRLYLITGCGKVIVRKSHRRPLRQKIIINCLLPETI